MKKLFSTVLVLCAAASLFAQNKIKVISSGELMVTGRPNGLISHIVGKSTINSLMLQIHWSNFIHKSKDIQMIPEKNGFRYTGSVDNIKFSSVTTVKDGRADTEYTVTMLPYEKKMRNWEVTPFYGMNWLKRFGTCSYTAECADGKKLTGDISKIIDFSGNVKCFTIHNFEGKDLIMTFPGGANLMDRRKEAKPQGLWFFAPVLKDDGKAPTKPGEVGTLKFSFEVKSLKEAGK